MDFFPTPPDPPDEDELQEHPQPVWMSAPEDVLPGVVPVELPLASLRILPRRRRLQVQFQVRALWGALSSFVEELNYSRSGSRDHRGPRRKPRACIVRQLPEPAGLGVQNPDLLRAAASRRKSEMAAVRCPRRTLVFAFTRQSLWLLVANVDHPHLKVAILLLICDRSSIRRPVGR